MGIILYVNTYAFSLVNLTFLHRNGVDNKPYGKGVSGSPTSKDFTKFLTTGGFLSLPPLGHVCLIYCNVQHFIKLN